MEATECAKIFHHNSSIPGILLTNIRAFSARLRFKCAPLLALYLFSSCFSRINLVTLTYQSTEKSTKIQGVLPMLILVYLIMVAKSELFQHIKTQGV